jgi:mRNA interferase RelE/StbE
MWTVAYAADAIKALARMDAVTARRIRAKVIALSADPLRPNNNVAKLVGVEGYRLRIGDWRVVYTLRHRELVIVIVRIGGRGSVYR